MMPKMTPDILSIDLPRISSRLQSRLMNVSTLPNSSRACGANKPSRHGAREPVDVPGKRGDIDLSPGRGQNRDRPIQPFEQRLQLSVWCFEHREPAGAGNESAGHIKGAHFED